MGLFAVSDDVQIATMVIGLIGTMFTAWIGYLMAKLNTKADDAAHEVNEVKTTLSESTEAFNDKLDNIADTGDKTHTLVNSQFGAQLKLHAETARAKADITHDKIDIIAAKTAENLLEEHVRKQSVVDGGDENRSKEKEIRSHHKHK